MRKSLGSKPAGKRGQATEKTPADPNKKEKQKKLNAHQLVDKAFQNVQEKLNEGDTKAIDDLVKLVKLEKDLGGEDQDVKEIRVRWETSEDKSSSEG